MARPPRQAGNLPAETSTFIGRRRELAEVRARISAARLVTLAGPGGVGKTRLAIRCAAGLARGFRDGGWLAELAETRNPALVPSAVLGGLNLHDQAAAEPRTLLLSYLRDKELLLILDNCEHLLEPAAGIVSDILRAAPGVRVIATSREPLSVPGEYVVQVPPLGAPDPHAPGELAQLRRTEAVMLSRNGSGGGGHVRADRRQSDGSRRPVPPPGRPAPGDRTRRGPRACPDGRADPRPPDQRLPPLRQWHGTTDSLTCSQRLSP